MTLHLGVLDRPAFASLILGVGMVATVSVQAGPPVIGAGDEIWIDGPALVQPGAPGVSRPAVAVDDNGRSIYAWEVFNPLGGDAIDVFLRRFDLEGNPIEDPFMANSTTADVQSRPRLAVAGDGTFALVWESQENDPMVGSNRNWSRLQVFDSSGAPVGSEQRINEVSTGLGTPIESDVAPLRSTDGSSNGFVVVWQSLNTNGLDDGLSIQGRRVSSGGASLGSQFEVNQFTSGQQTYPVVSELVDGGFLVVWRSIGDIKAQRFDSLGARVGGEFQVNETYAAGANQPEIALGWRGEVAVVWEDDDEVGNDSEIWMRIYDGTASPMGSDFRVNTLLTDTQDSAGVADHGPLGFLVTWESDFSVGDDADNSDSVQARLVTGPGTFGGEQIQYNVFVDQGQVRPASAGWYGRLATAWYSARNLEQNAPVITGRQVFYCIFCDDLEWGSDWRWSLSVP